LRSVTHPLIIASALLVAGLHSQTFAQQVKSQESLEVLTEDANDPTAVLAQLKIEEDYTPDEYETQAEPNTIQIQPVIPIRAYSLMPLQQIIRPTFKIITIPYGSGPSKHPVRRYTILRPVGLPMAGLEDNRP
jgi:hypothetical protein